MQRVGWKAMVCRKEKERYQQSRHRDGAAYLHDAFGLVVIGSQEFVVKKTMEEMAYKNLELPLVPSHGNGFRLNAKRQHRMFGRGEEAESFTHGGPP